ncbi:MAG: ABC transporter ATP-binding protein [Acidimicrobiia bacterium]
MTSTAVSVLEGAATTADEQRTPGGPAGGPDRGSLLSLEGLSVRFDTRHRSVTAVDDVSFELGRGERVALIGESGSGKTATCLAIAGFLTQPNVTVSTRRLSFDGQDVVRRRSSRLPTRTPGLAMVFQDAMTSLDPVWTIGSQITAVLRATSKCSRHEARERAAEWLGRVGLHDTRRVLRARPYELSGGMRQRVMLALALCWNPKLLIADEPTSALDASLARDAMELLLHLTDEMGTTLLIVSHDIRLSQEYCDRTLVMYGGRIVEQGPSRRIQDAPRHPYTIGLLESIPTLESADLDVLPTIAAPPGVGQADPDGGCSFRPRCPRAVESCATPPAESTVGPGHEVRCWAVELVAGPGTAPAATELAVGSPA